MNKALILADAKFQALTMEEILSTGKILRSHCQPKVGVTDGEYQSSRAQVLVL
jgi:hypothetical protein